MRIFQEQTLIAGLIVLAMATAACSGARATTASPDDQPDQASADIVAINSVDPDHPFGAYIPGQGLYSGSNISTIPGYEFIDQDSANLGFLICPLFFRNLDAEAAGAEL